MVRGWRRGTALACAGVLMFLALALGGAVIPRAANADSLDSAALASQKALVTSALHSVAAILDYQYEENQSARFSVYDLANATANMDIHTRSAGGGTDEAGLLVIQFPDSDSATRFTTSGNDWPVGNETVAIGSHQAAVSRDFNESANLAFSKIGWICGVHSNLVVLGFYYMTAKDSTGSTAARDKLASLAISVQDAFVSTGVCDNGKPASTTPPLDSTLQSLFGTFDVDVVTFIEQNTDADMQAVAAERASQLGAEMEATLLSQATDVGGLANVPAARDAFRRLVYLASLLDKNTGSPLFPTLVHPGVKALIDKMAVLSARDGTAVEPTDRLLTILAVADMTEWASRSGQ